MHISVIATDFDGTIAQRDQLPPEAGRALRRWREAGQFTVLASSRPLSPCTISSSVSRCST